MNSDSIDEDEPTFRMLFDRNSEDCMETCDDINDIVPRLQRLNINDEPMELIPEIMSISRFSMNTDPSLINNNEGASMAVSDAKFDSDASVKIWANEITKAVIVSEKSLSLSEETTQDIPLNVQVNTLSQNTIQDVSAEVEIHTHRAIEKPERKSEEPTELKENEAENVLEVSCLLDTFLKRDYAARSSSAVSENKTELLSLITAREKTKQVDLEIGEVLDASSACLQECGGGDVIGEALAQYTDEKASDAIFDHDSSKMSYSADVSSDDQAHMHRGAVPDSSPDVHYLGAVNPASCMNEIKPRRLNIFRSQSSIFSESEIATANFTSDEDSKKTSAIGNSSPINFKRRSKKAVKSYLKTRTPTSPDIKKDEEKRPRTRKRKNIFTENLVESTGKFRKRSLSEHNSETGEKTDSVIRSRSLSSGLKNSHCASVTNASIKTSPIQKSKKRTNSGFQNAGRFKSRRASG